MKLLLTPFVRYKFSLTLSLRYQSIKIHLIKAENHSGQLILAALPNCSQA